VRGADLFDDLKSGAAWHLDIEKQNVNRIRAKRLHNFAPAAALGRDHDVFIAAKKQPEPFACQRFVIGNQRLQLHPAHS
jgi:hypothetical protein